MKMTDKQSCYRYANGNRTHKNQQKYYNVGKYFILDKFIQKKKDNNNNRAYDPIK